MNEINDLLRHQIKGRGPISVADFMETALYCPGFGYYERDPSVIGFRGDFYTTPSIGPFFGHLLARQFETWFQELGPGTPHLVEAGPHDGTLAATILGWIGKNRPAIFDDLTYWIIEPSARRRSWQERKLGPLASRARWVDSIARLADETAGLRPGAEIARSTGPVRMIIFSNEFFDAFPVHRVQWDVSCGSWFECGVTLDGDRFVFTRLAEATIDIPRELADAGFNIPVELRKVLPDGYIIDLCPAAAAWWKQAAKALVRGKLMTIDYGGSAEELLIPERTGGTLRAYSRQRINDNILADPGEQDLTAHVNFSQLRAAGESAGLESDPTPSQPGFDNSWLWTQEQFFGNIIKQNGAARWSDQEIRQFQQITHPDQMGRLFRVLVQSTKTR